MFKKVFSIVLIMFSSSASYAGEWSDWVTIRQVNLHYSWGVKVETLENISLNCNTKAVEWYSSSDEVFMNRVLSSMLAAKFAQAKVRFWISNCDNGLAQVSQTQIQ